MGGVNDRRVPKTTQKFDSEKLARLTEQNAMDVAAPDPTFAEGSTPMRTAAGTDPPIDLRSRTTTVHDPLTTGLLAEVARLQVEDAVEDGDEDDKPTPTPHTVRR